MEIGSFSEFSLSLVALAALIPGIVQSVKELLGWDGVKVRALTMFVGMFFGGLFYGVDQGLVPGEYHQWIKLGVFTLMSGPAAMGYYSLLFKPLRLFVEGNTETETFYERPLADILRQYNERRAE